VYRNLVQLSSLLLILLGAAILVITLAHGSFGVGILLGVLFIAAGAGRLYLARRRAG
jgi:membrane-bound ClpP family serine protease